MHDDNEHNILMMSFTFQRKEIINVPTIFLRKKVFTSQTASFQKCAIKNTGCRYGTVVQD